MHPLCGGGERLGEAVGKDGDKAVDVHVGMDGVVHAGHIHLDLSGRKAVDGLALGDLAQQA